MEWPNPLTWCPVKTAPGQNGPVSDSQNGPVSDSQNGPVSDSQNGPIQMTYLIINQWTVPAILKSGKFSK